MIYEDFTVTLNGSSVRLPSWLFPEFSEFLHPKMQALYIIEHLIEEDEVVGIQINVKKPIEIGKRMKSDGIIVSRHSNDDLHLYLPKKENLWYAKPCKFRLEEVSAKVRCKFNGDWLKFYYAEAKFPVLWSAFK